MSPGLLPLRARAGVPYTGDRDSGLASDNDPPRLGVPGRAHPTPTRRRGLSGVSRNSHSLYSMGLGVPNRCGIPMQRRDRYAIALH